MRVGTHAHVWPRVDMELKARECDCGQDHSCFIDDLLLEWSVD